LPGGANEVPRGGQCPHLPPPDYGPGGEKRKGREEKKTRFKSKITIPRASPLPF